MSRLIAIIVFCFFSVSANGSEKSNQCGDFSSDFLRNSQHSMVVWSHRYAVSSTEFVDGWHKLTIRPLGVSAEGDFKASEASISFLMARCLCGYNPKISFLHKNIEHEYIYRYRCDTGSLAIGYEIMIISTQENLK
tara:strand:- start:1021 stop:1428 length:408 start_codon:yes stop_codon:yes gene_type:complete